MLSYFFFRPFCHNFVLSLPDKLSYVFIFDLSLRFILRILKVKLGNEPPSALVVLLWVEFLMKEPLPSNILLQLADCLVL